MSLALTVTLQNALCSAQGSARGSFPGMNSIIFDDYSPHEDGQIMNQ